MNYDVYDKNWKEDFAKSYNHYCALHSCCPLSNVVQFIGDNRLDFNSDRIREPEWTPIYEALKTNSSLVFLRIKSSWKNSLQDQELLQRAYLLKRKPPAIRSRIVLQTFCRSLRDCLNISSVLTNLTLHGLHFAKKDLTLIAQGIQNTSSLKNLSFEHSKLGDSGWLVLHSSIKNCLHIHWLNLTSCKLSYKSTELLAELIKSQATKRYGTTWQDSLRYRRPDLDRMPGLRRITLNQNQAIGLDGINHLADALKDDLWIKAIDLQDCDVSNDAAECILNMLQFNSTLMVVDIRLNSAIDDEYLKDVLGKALQNGNGESDEYPWLTHDNSTKFENQTQQPSKSKKHTTKLKSVSSRRSKPRKVTTQVAAMKYRSPSSTQSHTHFEHLNNSKHRIPWRTAERMFRHISSRIGHGEFRSLSPKTHAVTKLMQSPTSKMHDILYSTVESDNHIKDHKDRYEQHNIPSRDYKYESTTSQKSIEVLQLEMKLLKKRLIEEIQGRSSIDTRLKELELENKALRDENCHLKSSLHQYQQSNSPLTAPSPSALLKDDNVLDNIEKSFKQFQKFLDLLHATGTDYSLLLEKAVHN